MNFSTKVIRLFLELQELVNHETSQIFRPIIEEVERQGEGVLLFPPVQGTLWAEWLVKPPKNMPFNHYRHLLLMVQQASGDELTLVLADRYAGKPDDLKRIILIENYRAGRLARYEWDLPFSTIQGNEPGELLEDEDLQEGPFSGSGLEILARQLLKGKIEAKAVAERIVAEGREMQWEQVAIAKECRKERARRRERVRRKLTMATPIN